MQHNRLRQTENPLDLPLLDFGGDHWTVRDAIQGTLILGSIGSGKTSGSGATLARTFLHAGWGGLVLSATHEERILWKRYAADTHRQNSLLLFGPGSPWRFDFLRYITALPGARHTENIVRLFRRLAELGQAGQQQGTQDGFWLRGMEQMLRAALDPLLVAHGNFSLSDLYDMVTSFPNCNEEVHSEAWQNTAFCYRVLQEAEEASKTARQDSDVALAARYILNQFPNIAEKTRSIFVQIFTGIADALLRGMMADLFSSGEINILPEMAQEGAVILLDLPVMEYGYAGQLAQVLFQELFLMAQKRRQVTEDSRPCFLFADECQHFVNAETASFQNTARHSLTATVYLTQNLPNLYSAFPGHHAEDLAKRFCGCLNSRLFHANGDPTTNEYASNVIGKDWITLDQFSAGANSQGETHPSVSEHKVFEFVIPPARFTTLRTGGPGHRFQVDAVLFQSGGRSWSRTGKPWLPVTFTQTR